MCAARLSSSARWFGLKPVVPTTSGIFCLAQTRAICERALGQREVDHDVERAHSGSASLASATRRRGDTRKGAGILAELLMSGMLECGAELELRVSGDELDQPRAHAARCAVNADLRAVFTHGSSSFRLVAIQGLEGAAPSVAE